MKVRITYKDIGRNKFNHVEEFNIKSEHLIECVQSSETQAYEEVKKHLLSSIVNLSPNEEEYNNKNTYNVYVGDFPRLVGSVIIEVLE